jgi:pyruvate,water dikinase
MTSTTAPFVPPGPGTWQLDAVHFTRPVTRLFAGMFPAAFSQGFREGVRIYGALLDTLEFGAVNSLLYFAPRGVGAPKGAKGPPPKFLFKALLHLHPEMRRRVATARDLFERRPWREDLRRWDEEIKPAAVRSHLEIQAVDPASLASDGLLAHLERCRQHWGRMMAQHHRFDVPALLPVGDFLVHTREWTGLEPSRLCRLLSGASHVSSGGSPELDRLSSLLRVDKASRSRFEAEGRPAEALATLRSAEGELGAAARSWLDMVSHRLQNGLDFCERTNIETPEMLVTTLRGALGGGAEAKRASVPADGTGVRDQVPAVHRPQFDELLAEARLVYRLRDERGLYSDLWAAGILRRSLLEAGRRLVAAGRLERADLFIDADWDEMQALLRGSGGPSSEELAGRARYRATLSPHEVPAQLGPASAGPPPPEWLPPASARMERAIAMGIGGIFAEPPPRNEARIVRGLGVSAGKIEGIARIVLDATGFDRLRQGDILVSRSTTAAFNVILPMLGGIVTDRGGSLSHSAIVAREYGIPAVVGSRDATRIIPDGARLQVDGDLGEVKVL